MIVIREAYKASAHNTNGVENEARKKRGLNPRSILPRIDRFELISLALNIEASDFQHVGHKGSPWPSLYLDDDLQGIDDIDREVRYLDTTLKDAGREPRKPQRGPQTC